MNQFNQALQAKNKTLGELLGIRQIPVVDESEASTVAVLTTSDLMHRDAMEDHKLDELGI